MYLLEQMMKETMILLDETERRERALKRIFHVLSIVGKQREHTKISIMLMLKYEADRQKMLLEQKWLHRKISREQKEEYEKSIQIYEEYVQKLIEQMKD